MVLFRADGNPDIGSGHIMRCLSIADAFRAKGTECVFVLAGDEMARVIDERGYENRVLRTDYKDMEGELPRLNSVLNDLRIDAVFVDSYYATSEFMRELKRIAGGKLAYIDDVASFAYPCDYLINYSIYAEEWRQRYCDLYDKSGIEEDDQPKMLLGLIYVPLRKEFAKIRHRNDDLIGKPKTLDSCNADGVQASSGSHRMVQNILISTGGSDREHIAFSLINEIMDQEARLQNYRFHFVVGAMNKDVHSIKNISEKVSNIEIHFDVKDMASLMRSCDIALSAAGSTLYELCATQTPTVTYALADNQIPGGEGFQRLGLMRYVGDAREIGERFAGVAIEEVIGLTNDREERLRMAQAMGACVDGHGAERIVGEILGQDFYDNVKN